MNTELWLSLCKHLNSPFINHFIEMQNLINKLQQCDDENNEINQIVIQIQEYISQIVQIIDIDHQHLLNGFEQSLLLLASLNDEDKIKQFETLQLIQDLFNKLALSYFLNEDDIQEQKTQLPLNDGTSTCSDFSDDNYEVEDFEAQAAIELFQQIKNQLDDFEISQKCQSFQFTINEQELNLIDFFTDALELQIKEYDIIIFLNYSGLLQKLMNYKNLNQLEYFITQLQIVLQKITSNEIDSIVDANCFELKYSRLSQRKFMRCKFLSKLYTKIVYEKLDRWRANQSVQEIHGENLKALRKFIVQNKAPLSRWEVSILSIQDVQVNNDNIIDKFQKLIIALSLPYDLLLENFLILDKLYVNQQQFFKWIKITSIPFTIQEISQLFQACSTLYGYYTLEGIKIIQRCDFYSFLNKVYAINIEDESKIKQKQDHKYNDEVTIIQQNKHLLIKTSDLQQQLEISQKKIRQLEDQLDQQQTQRILPQTYNNNKENDEIIKNQILLESEVNQLKNEHSQQMKINELKWKNKIKELLFELENKDKQIDRYRQQLEALIKELEWVKTERNHPQ